MSAAAQQMRIMKSFRNSRAPSRTNTAPAPRKRSAAPPLPPMPKPISPETSAGKGNPYNHQSHSIFKCGIQGFQKWYDKETWKFFDDEETLYFTEAPRRLRASSANLPGQHVKDSAKTIDDMSVAELTQHVKDLKHESKRNAQRVARNSKVGGADWVEKQYKEKKMGRQQKQTRQSQEGSIQKLFQQANQQPEKNERAKSVSPKRTKKIKKKPKKKAPPPPPETMQQPETATASTTTTTASAAERLVAILVSFKALKLCIESGGDPTKPDSVGYVIPTELELAQGLSFIRKQVMSFETRAWAVARGGGVGSIAAILYYYCCTCKSLAPWIIDGLQSLTTICSLLFEATRKGTSKKGLKRTLKLDLVVTIASIVIVTSVVPQKFKIQASSILDMGLECLKIFCDELCPSTSQHHVTSNLKDIFKGQDDFGQAGGLHALLLVNDHHANTTAGKLSRILLKRFSMTSLLKM